jgi:hypothetical protein
MEEGSSSPLWIKGTMDPFDQQNTAEMGWLRHVVEPLVCERHSTDD